MFANNVIIRFIDIIIRTRAPDELPIKLYSTFDRDRNECKQKKSH